MAKVYGNANAAAAVIAGQHPFMDRAMSRVHAAVKSEAARHNDSGAFSASIKSKRVSDRTREVEDRLVYSTDPLAWHKEFGHRAPDGSWVEGNFSFTNAANKVSR